MQTEDVQIAHILYKRVAEASLAHWLDGNCKGCSGTGVTALLGKRTCMACKGTGKAEVTGMRQSERKLTLDMVSELTALRQPLAPRQRTIATLNTTCSARWLYTQPFV